MKVSSRYRSSLAEFVNFLHVGHEHDCLGLAPIKTLPLHEQDTMRTRVLQAHPTASRLVGAGIVTALVTTLAAAPANAAPDPIDATASVIAKAAPDQGAVIVPQRDESHAEAAASIAGDRTLTNVEVPLDPDEPVTVAVDQVDTAVDAPEIAVGLPDEVAVAPGKIATDGTIVYEATDDGADAAVQILEDGSVRFQTVIPDADAPHKFTYTFGNGVKPFETEDGTVELVQEFDGGVVTLGVVDSPWAVDSNGSNVETSFSIEGSSLVQTVVPDEVATYPIVADPVITSGPLYLNVYFNRRETANVADGAAAAAVVFSSVPAPAGPILVASSSILSIAANRFHRDGSCLRVGWYGGQPPFGTWAPTPHDGIYCR